MKVAGIIAEYNPFHRGHQYHMSKTRKLSGADYVIAIMSGNFVQRGEPAICDKYMRTRMALAGGADLVIELPAQYATASAETFAGAGVKLLSLLGCVDILSFGSEWGTLRDYESYVRLFTEESESYQSLLRAFLAQGFTFPEARARAAAGILSQSQNKQTETMPSDGYDLNKRTEKAGKCGRSGLDIEMDTLGFLKEPNHILGLEYLKALAALSDPVFQSSEQSEKQSSGQSDALSAGRSDEQSDGHSVEPSEFLSSRPALYSGIRPLLIRREGAAYHDRQLPQDMAVYPSATAIREECMKETPDENLLIRAMGEEGRRLFKEVIGGGSVSWDDLMPLLDYEMLMGHRFGRRLSDSVSLSDRDLYAHIVKCYQPGLSFRELVDHLHSRNQTDAALKRKLLRILLRMDLQPFVKEQRISYARVLGFRRQAAPLLKEIRRRVKIPVFQKPALGLKKLKGQALEDYLTDIRASDLYEQLAANKAGRPFLPEFKRQQIIIC